jgi:hypothetical protein
MNIEEWPVGATHKIDDDFTQWIDGVERVFRSGKWHIQGTNLSLDQYKSSYGFKIIERPVDAPYMPKVGEWCDYRTVQKGEHRKAFFIGHNESGEHVLKDVHGDFIEDNCNFRPIKTERDILIDIISLNINMDIASSGIASAILAAGFTNKP